MQPFAAHESKTPLFYFPKHAVTLSFVYTSNTNRNLSMLCSISFSGSRLFGRHWAVCRWKGKKKCNSSTATDKHWAVCRWKGKKKCNSSTATDKHWTVCRWKGKKKCNSGADTDTESDRHWAACRWKGNKQQPLCYPAVCCQPQDLSQIKSPLLCKHSGTTVRQSGQDH